MGGRTAISLLGTLGAIAAVVVAWLTLGPIGFGGSTGYAMVIGTSMEPQLHRGDLVLVRRSPDYRVGQIVAYNSSTLGRIVLHRIIGQTDGRYVFKGDNNDFVDPGTAQRSQLIGSYWFKIGGAAPVLAWFHQPLHAALLAAILGLLAFGGGAGAAVGRRRRRRQSSDGTAPRQLPALPDVSERWQPAAAVAGCALAAFAALGVLAYAVPATTRVPTDRLYSQSGRFSYTAAAPRGPAYPSGRVASGQAIFTRLVDTVEFRFRWSFESDAPHLARGTAALAAELSDGAGWTYRLPLAPRHPFAGDSVDLGGALRLEEIQAVLRRFETATGTHSGTYQVRIVPDVRVTGTVAGKPLNDTFAPPLQFSFDQFRLQLVASSDPAQPNGLTRTVDVGGMTTEANQIRLAGLHVALRPARLAAWLGGAISLAVLALALLGRSRTGRSERNPGVDARYARWIVRVAAAPRADRVVEVTDFEELVRLAERYDRLILSCEQTGAYVVEEEGVSYRWRPVLAPLPAAAGDDALSRLAGMVAEQAERPRPVERRDLSSRPWQPRVARDEQTRAPVRKSA